MLNHIDTPTLFLLRKLISDECSKDGRREDLGLRPKSFEVLTPVAFVVEGTVKISKSTEDAVTPAKADPWTLLVRSLEVANTKLEEVGEAPITLEDLIGGPYEEAVEGSKEAKKKANSLISKVKAPTRSFRWGAVRASGSISEEVLSFDAREGENALSRGVQLAEMGT